jgi:hypothetical protein
MLTNMESAAADDFAALMRGIPCPPALARPEAQILAARMTRIVLDLHFAGEPVTRADFERNGFEPSEIDELSPRAFRTARSVIDAIDARGIRRVRVPAGNAAHA